MRSRCGPKHTARPACKRRKIAGVICASNVTAAELWRDEEPPVKALLSHQRLKNTATMEKVRGCSYYTYEMLKMLEIIEFILFDKLLENVALLGLEIRWKLWLQNKNRNLFQERFRN
jgi:hypothetical protein